MVSSRTGFASSSSRTTRASSTNYATRQLGLPPKKGRAGTMTHDYKRHGTTTLFAALNVLDGTVIGRYMQRHRHQEFIRFLNAIGEQVPAEKKDVRPNPLSTSRLGGPFLSYHHITERKGPLAPP
jgi:hypothetical protein